MEEEEEENSYSLTKENMLPLWPAVWVCDKPIWSNKILFLFAEELLQKQKETSLTRQHVCLVLGLLIKSQGRVGFQVWSQENISLNAHIFAVWHRAWKPITQTVVAIWFVFQERLSSWDIIRDECWVMCTKDSSHLTSKAPTLTGPCPKKDLSAERELWLVRIKELILGNDMLLGGDLEMGMGTAFVFCWRTRKRH